LAKLGTRHYSFHRERAGYERPHFLAVANLAGGAQLDEEVAYRRRLHRPGDHL
jgi:hypothetical protein